MVTKQTRRTFGFAGIWFFAGVVATVVVMAAINSLPATYTLTQPVVYAPSNPSASAFEVAYTVPKDLTVGDAADVRVHIHNSHLLFRDKRTRKPGTISVTVSVSANANCGATAITPTKQGLPQRTLTSVFEWTVIATKPGQCGLNFTTRLPELGQTQINTLAVGVYERFTPSEEATIIAAVIGAIALIVAALIARSGSGKTGDGEKRPQIVLP